MPFPKLFSSTEGDHRSIAPSSTIADACAGHLAGRRKAHYFSSSSPPVRVECDFELSHSLILMRDMHRMEKIQDARYPISNRRRRSLGMESSGKLTTSLSQGKLEAAPTQRPGRARRFSNCEWRHASSCSRSLEASLPVGEVAEAQQERGNLYFM